MRLQPLVGAVLLAMMLAALTLLERALQQMAAEVTIAAAQMTEAVQLGAQVVVPVVVVVQVAEARCRPSLVMPTFCL